MTEGRSRPHSVPDEVQQPLVLMRDKGMTFRAIAAVLNDGAALGTGEADAFRDLRDAEGRVPRGQNGSRWYESTVWHLAQARA